MSDFRKVSDLYSLSVGVRGSEEGKQAQLSDTFAVLLLI